MAHFRAIMCEAPDNQRLANLKLYGLPYGSLVVFCVRCDFEEVVRDRPPMCRHCHGPLVLARVEPELLRKANAA